jgi:hypothetical protein
MARQILISLVGLSNPLDGPSNQLNELQECIMCVSMLHNIQGGVAAVCILPPTSNGLLPCSWPYRNDQGDILRYAAKLTEVWQAARVYAATRPALDAPPPWSPASDYSKVTQLHLEVDTLVPIKHRFGANRIDKEDPENLQELRDYWGPWLFLQFVYSAIPCLLNHPFLLSLRLRGFRTAMPHAFVQQSFEQTNRLVGWFDHFLDVLEEKQFAVSDPTLAHCIAIVATLHLQHSFVIDVKVRAKARSSFDKCIAFLRRMSSAWKIVEVMV